MGGEFKWGTKKIKATRQADGRKKKMRVRKATPKRCSVPWQVCIRCKRTRIHRNDSRLKSKVCGDCERATASAILAPALNPSLEFRGFTPDPESTRHPAGC